MFQVFRLGVPGTLSRDEGVIPIGNPVNTHWGPQFVILNIVRGAKSIPFALDNQGGENCGTERFEARFSGFPGG
jgi:hypothetical protein